jgi:hypothetical protein
VLWNDLVETSIWSVGGYWPALAGLARLLEELGEVAVELRKERLEQSNIAEELADVFFISTCLANQYCADLSAHYADAGLTPSLTLSAAAESPSTAFFDLVISAGSLARTINMYEGSKPPKPNERVTRIGEGIAHLHRALAGLAAATGVSLADEVRATCHRKSTRDRARFKPSHDASLCAALDAFRSLQPRPHLPSERLWGASAWVEPDRQRSLDRIAGELARFTRIIPFESLNGFIVHLPRQPFGASTAHLAAATKYLLLELAERDESPKPSTASGFDRDDWRFLFGGQPLFISSFCIGSSDVFILFQPERSFQTLQLARRQPPARWWEADLSLLG